MTAEDLSKVLCEAQLGTRKSQLTLAEIEKGLSIKVQRKLATALVLISKGDKLPAQQDLSCFWGCAVCAINGLSTDFKVVDLRRPHIRELGPVVLGSPVWQLLQNALLDDWEELKQAVEHRFGLTRD